MLEIDKCLDLYDNLGSPLELDNNFSDSLFTRSCAMQLKSLYLLSAVNKEEKFHGITKIWFGMYLTFSFRLLFH